jgi:hypothetical protein
MFNMFKNKKWQKLESGQALMEYWPAIPASIMVMISAGLIVSFLRGSFGQTVDILTVSDIEVCEENEEDKTGPETIVVDRHTIIFVGDVYDPETDTTTVTYRVTSEPGPDLSHWVLSIPKGIADKITDVSEQWGWTDADPTTGVSGIKFDTGYEGSGGGGPPADKGPKNKIKPGGRQIMQIYMLQEDSSSGETREISITLDGHFEFEPTVVTTKSGADNIGTGEIPAPSVIIIDLGTTRENCD